jgi:flavin reductase (DIM6/NTAB) family NADH-FMN oxidoreductase RutF
MIKIDPNSLPAPKIQHLLQGAVAPRPIAFASTIDKEGNPNLSPFSFFNLFGVNPTTLIFSPSRRSRDNTTKHTYQNLKEVPEVVINMVNFSMIEQVNLASTEYPKGVNEFIKAGFTPIASENIKPFRVKESPVQLECKVRQIIETGDQGGSGNLVICDLLLIHLNAAILDENGRIDPNKIDLVGRMGGGFYCRASGNAVFEVEKPLIKLGIGIDNLPEKIRNSKILSGNDLGKLGNVENLPDSGEIEQFRNVFSDKSKITGNINNPEFERNVTQMAKDFLEKNDPVSALKLLIAYL